MIAQRTIYIAESLPNRLATCIYIAKHIAKHVEVLNVIKRMGICRVNLSVVVVVKRD